MDEIEEELEVVVIKEPNDYRYRKYNKTNKEFICGTDEPSDSTDPDFATTIVPLPVDTLNYIFDEGIQMWRGMQNDEFFDYKQKFLLPEFSPEDEFKMWATLEMAKMRAEIEALKKERGV